MVVNGILDARMPLITSHFQDNPREALEKFGKATLPKFCGHVESILSGHGGPFITGASLTYADVSLYEFLLYASEALSSTVDELLNGFAKLLCQFHTMHAFDHLLEFTASTRRKPLPDETFIRQVTSILSLPLPSHLQTK